MRAARLVTILLMLQDRGRVTARELSQVLEVSVRTVHRDLEALGAGGVPVYAERGAGGGFRLLEGYQARLTGFTAEEIEALWMLGNPGVLQALDRGEASTSAMLKVIAALPEEQRQGARDAARRVHVEERDTAMPPAGWARAVLDSARVGRVLRLIRGTAATDLEPLGLIRNGDRWLAVGRVDGAVRALDLARFDVMHGTAGSFAPDAAFDVAKWWHAQRATDTRTPR